MAGRPRANTLARKGRVTRRSKVEINILEEESNLEVEKKPSAVSRKRGGASSTEALKERQVLSNSPRISSNFLFQVSALSPVVEGLNKTSSRLPTSSSSNILAQFRFQLMTWGNVEQR